MAQAERFELPRTVLETVMLPITSNPCAGAGVLWPPTGWRLEKEMKKWTI